MLYNKRECYVSMKTRDNLQEQLNWAARGCALAGRADSVRKALSSLIRTLTTIYPQVR